MSIQLLQGDFDRLVNILSAQYEWSSQTGRWDFMSEVFAGSPRKADILGNLDLSGTPRGVAVRVIGKLAVFGQDEAGRESLGVLVNKLLAYLGGGDDADFLRSLFARYPFTTSPAAAKPVAGEWHGRDTTETTAEKIIGENTLRDVSLLETLLDASRAVVRISSPLGLGTGFMVAADLVMTNHHVIANPDDAGRCAFAFNHQLDRNGKAREAYIAHAAAGGLFHTSPFDEAGVRDDALDYTVVQLADAPAAPGAFAPLTLRPARAKRDGRVSIIQHPGGDYKKISLQNNFIAYADGRVVQYTTSTEPGSSGSPVLDDDVRVIAIHHAGGMMPEPATQRRYLRNEGVSMVAVVEDLRQNAPAIHERVKRG